MWRRSPLAHLGSPLSRLLVSSCRKCEEGLSVRPAVPARAFVVPLAEAWNRIALANPGLPRLLPTRRCTLAVFLATVAWVVAGREIGAATVHFATGVLFAYPAPVLAREPTSRERRASMLRLSLPAILIAVATSPRGQGLAGAPTFFVLVFARRRCSTNASRSERSRASRSRRDRA